LMLLKDAQQQASWLCSCCRPILSQSLIQTVLLHAGARADRVIPHARTYCCALVFSL
jgi:hypothetical protein